MTQSDVPIMSIDPNDPDEAILGRAARVLEEGGLVAFPTETFYGLGADPWSESAIETLFEAKGRPSHAPILLLLASEEQISMVAASRPQAFDRLARAFWPGPLTLVLPARPDLSARLTAGTGGIGVRISGSPLARALPRALGRPVTGTSANATGTPPPHRAQDLQDALAGGYARIALVLDSGESPGGPPSTVLDITGPSPTLVREGAIPHERILEALR